MALTKNPNVLKWVDEMIALTKPAKVVWIDGSDEQLNALKDEAVSTGEMRRLNPEKLPGCLYHRTLPNDVARVEDRTFICSRKKEDAGPTNNWMDPKEMYAKLTPMYDGVMKDRTMYIIPYSMGPIGSAFSKVGVEITDSIYVVLNMDIMTRMGARAFEQLGDESNDFVRGLHSKANIDPENRYIVQFPEDNTICAGIISNAVKEVEGVRGIAPLPKNPIQQWFKGDDFGDIRIGLVDDVLSVSVGIIINGGAKAVHTAEKVQNKIKSAVQGMLGITVAKVNVKVCDAVF